MKINLKNLKEKLDKLKAIDNNYSIFGASGHGYRSYPVPISEIEIFEQKYNFILPETFRVFLLEIGYGAGPYYGIWNIKEIDSELTTEIQDYKREENIIVNPTNIFPFKREDIELLKNSFNNSFPHEDKRNTYPINGNITILHQGCQGYSTLVTTGEFRGTVWDLYYDGGYDGYWHPAMNTPCLVTSNRNRLLNKYKVKHFPDFDSNNHSLEPIDFIDWYENWLDNSILAFRELEEFNSFRIFNRQKPI